VAEFDVPKGQLIMCLMRAGATDERRFPDAQAFEPERWSSTSATVSCTGLSVAAIAAGVGATLSDSGSVGSDVMQNQ